MQIMPFAACLGLFGATFFQEAVALASGSALILSGTVAAPWVAVSLTAGMIAGDCIVYGLGRLARKSPWAHRAIAGVDLNEGETWLSRNLLLVVPTSHLVPWLLVPTFVALGWFNVPFKRFAAVSAGFNLVYVPIALLILTKLGGVAWPYLAGHQWVLWLAGAMLITAAIAVRFRRAAS